MSNNKPEERKPLTPATPEDFYHGYAIAMLTWQKVEEALFRFFYTLFKGDNLIQAGAAYYSLESFGAKLRLVNDMAKAVRAQRDIGNLDGDKDAAAQIAERERKVEDLHASWTALHTELKAAAADRNVLAHLPARIKYNEDLSISLILTNPIYVPQGLIRTRKKEYDAAEFLRLAHRFDILETELDKLKEVSARLFD